ncbi:major facilitator superfamily domain-containing protein [Fusarium tricinctum]|uniref:Major facilitator superfamily domain-containing protein n=1 Tax=Fusarium tricinctum TaxID=61284 RepID=A0A8K0S3H5_9HYPO|nr:major facilitator superfamily domain-containing protein [Fusarium tricinctum]
MNNKHSHLGVEVSKANASNTAIDEESPLLVHTQARSTLTQHSHDTETAPTDQEPSTRYLAVVFGSVFIGVFLAALDTTIVATLSVPISDSFGSLNLVSWLGSSYLIANAACQPLSGRLTDIFSRRSGLIVLLAGRIVAGMGGGGLNAIVAFLASDFVPLRRRGVIQGFVHICYSVGAGLGGLFGGWVNDLWGWRAAFLSRVPLIVVSTTLVFFTLRSAPSTQNETDKSKLSRVDFLGAFTLSLTLVLLLLTLNSGGNIVPWNHPLVFVSASLSIVAAISFSFVETRWAKEPIIPMHLLLDRSVLAACMMNCLITMTLFMATFYVPIFFQVNGLSTSASGLRLLPQSIGTSVSSLTCGFIVKRTGKYRTLSLVVIASSALGFIGLSTMTVDTSTILILIYILLVGVGYGGMLSISVIATVAAVSPDEQAVATSAIYAFRSTGSTVGVTVASVVYQNLLQHGLHQRFDTERGSAEVIERILKSLDELKHLPEGWVKGVYEAYAVAVRGVFLSGLGLAVLGLVATGVLKEHRLHNTLSRADQN